MTFMRKTDTIEEKREERSEEMSADKRYDIVALGEILVDFTPCGESEQGNSLLEVNPGGAPCNVLAMAAKIGAKTAFIGKAGDDSFGRMLKETADRAGICTDGLILDDSVFTTLAFVHLDAAGDRSFSFCRKPGADTCLRKEELKTELIRAAKIFHFGTLSMTDEPAASATKAAVTLAKESGALISFDPNIRPLLWKDMEQAKRAMQWGFSQCDILKISDDELRLVSDTEDSAQAMERLLTQYPNIRLLFVTMGADGCCWRYGTDSGKCAAPHVQTVDTTGAGDTFMGCCLAETARLGIDRLTEENLREIVEFANSAAALVTTKKGAMKSMPDKAEVLRLMEKTYH